MSFNFESQFLNVSLFFFVAFFKMLFQRFLLFCFLTFNSICGVLTVYLPHKCYSLFCEPTFPHNPLSGDVTIVIPYFVQWNIKGNRNDDIRCGLFDFVLAVT